MEHTKQKIEIAGPSNEPRSSPAATSGEEQALPEAIGPPRGQSTAIRSPPTMPRKRGPLHHEHVRNRREALGEAGEEAAPAGRSCPWLRGLPWSRQIPIGLVGDRPDVGGTGGEFGDEDDHDRAPIGRCELPSNKSAMMIPSSITKVGDLKDHHGGKVGPFRNRLRASATAA